MFTESLTILSKASERILLTGLVYLV